jgi:hypothetical protein
MALSACGGSSEPEAQATDVPKAVAGNSAAQAVENQFGTPVKDRVATLGLLNKRNNEQQDIVLKVGEAKRVGNVVVKLATCEKTQPWERPQETGAFVQVFVEQRAQVSEPLRWQKVFSGWLFRNSPGLNVVQHPVYDVWVKDCAMNFPGEEEIRPISPRPRARQRHRAAKARRLRPSRRPLRSNPPFLIEGADRGSPVPWAASHRAAAPDNALRISTAPSEARWRLMNWQSSNSAPPRRIADTSHASATLDASVRG